MNSALLFDFLVNKENNTLTIKREFAAERQMVWDAYTKQEHLDQWFAPKPLTTKTKSMSFKEGGHWVYAMVEPNGTEYWGRTDYLKIKPIDFYTALDAFSDKDGNINPDLPRANWLIKFSDYKGNSIVETVVTYQSLADLETVIQMNMEEGMKSTLGKLDELLIKLKNK